MTIAPDDLDTAPCGFLAFADDGRIVKVNRTLQEMLGLPAAALVGGPLESVLTVASRIFYQTHFFPLVRLHGHAEEVFLTFRASDGSEVPALVNALRKGSGEEVVNHCVVISVRRRREYEDEILRAKRAAEEAVRSNEALIHAQKELERHSQDLDRKLRRLAQKNAELARVSHILSHDLTEFIRKVSWFAETLRDEEGSTLTASGAQAMEKIAAACRTTDELIQRLRDFVSLDVEGSAAQVDLNEVVADAARHVMTRGGADELRVECAPLPVVEGHRRQLVLLFRNLFDNSVRFRRPDEAPWVRLDGSTIRHNGFRAIQDRYRYVEAAKIVVRDNSLGFDARHGDRVFEALTNVRTDASGLGFGLATCRKVVENHHGAISVASEPGRGATFTLLLPLTQ